MTRDPSNCPATVGTRSVRFTSIGDGPGSRKFVTLSCAPGRPTRFNAPFQERTVVAQPTCHRKTPYSFHTGRDFSVRLRTRSRRVAGPKTSANLCWVWGPGLLF